MKNDKKKEKKKAEKRAQKKAENRALKFEKHTKCKKIFSKHFFVRVLAQNFFNYHETYILSQISFCKNSFKNECSSESETKDLFGCTQ